MTLSMRDRTMHHGYLLRKAAGEMVEPGRIMVLDEIPRAATGGQGMLLGITVDRTLA